MAVYTVYKSEPCVQIIQIHSKFEIIFFLYYLKRPLIRWRKNTLLFAMHMINDGWSLIVHIQFSTRFAYDSVAWFNAFIFLYQAVIGQFAHKDQQICIQKHFSLSSIFIHYQVSYGQDRAVEYCDQNELYIFSFIDTLWKIDHHQQCI